MVDYTLVFHIFLFILSLAFAVTQKSFPLLRPETLLGARKKTVYCSLGCYVIFISSWQSFWINILALLAGLLRLAPELFAEDVISFVSFYFERLTGGFICPGFYFQS
jgi:hypothetical protein